VIASLAESIFRSTDPFVLALDEMQALANEESIEIVMTLLDELPGNAQIAIASRTEPNLPLGRLRAEGLVADVGPNDLRFDAAEVGALLSANGLRVSPAEVRAVAERTEGWPVAVYLAARALNAGGDAPSFSGEERSMRDYIRSEFLQGQPDEVARFLRQSSILHEMSGPLCDAVLERSGSGSLLEEIERSNLLVVPMDRTRRWYRYHHLLREALVAECERSDPEAMPALKLRASDWFESQGRVEEAVWYGQAADELERVEAIVSRHAMRLFAMGREDALRPWFDWLTERGSADGAIAVMCGWLKLLIGAVAEADRCAAIAEAGDMDRMLPDGSPVEAWTYVLRCAMAKDPVSMRTQASRALELLAPASQLRGTALAILGFAHLMEDSLEIADRVLADAVDLAAAVGATGAGISSLGALTAIALEDGRWDDAASLSSRGVGMIESAHFGGYAGAALVHAGRARVAAHTRDHAEARKAVQDAEELMSFLSPGVFPLAILTREILTRAYLELGEVASAAKTLSELEDLMRRVTGFDQAVDALARLRRVVRDAQKTTRGGAKLSPAELRLLPWLATQLSFREIAEQLFVSVHTVKAQVTSIYGKLGVASRTQAVEEARRKGLLND
jgi:LuxR family maltose regulon positive regulatory protein